MHQGLREIKDYDLLKNYVYIKIYSSAYWKTMSNSWHKLLLDSLIISSEF